MGGILCRICGIQVLGTPCAAKKIMSDTNCNVVLFRHKGTHISTLGNKNVCFDEKRELSQLFPNIKTAVASNTIVKQAVTANSSPEQISEVAPSLVDTRNVEQVKKKAGKVLLPHGTNIEVVLTFKESLAQNEHNNSSRIELMGKSSL